MPGTLVELLEIKNGELVALTGSGGKTSIMHELAYNLDTGSFPVIISTSTRIGKPDPRFCRRIISSSDFNHSSNFYPFPCVISLREEEPEKVFSPGIRYIKEFLWADGVATVIFEADGSRRLPLKLYAEREPVLSGCESRCIVVISLVSMGKEIRDVVHRYELLSPAKREGVVDVTFIYNLLFMKNGYFDKAMSGEVNLIINGISDEIDFKNGLELASRVRKRKKECDICLRGSFFGYNGFFYKSVRADV